MFTWEWGILSSKGNQIALEIYYKSSYCASVYWTVCRFEKLYFVYNFPKMPEFFHVMWALHVHVGQNFLYHHQHSDECELAVCLCITLPSFPFHMVEFCSQGKSSCDLWAPSPVLLEHPSLGSSPALLLLTLPTATLWAWLEGWAPTFTS